MIILATTTQKITGILAAAVTTTAPVFLAAYGDATATALTEGMAHGELAATSADLVTAPAASTRRVVRNITIYNADTVEHTILLALVDGATTRPLWKITLDAGETWDYLRPGAIASSGTGTDGKTVLSGTGAPSALLGVDGDFYVDKSAWDIYGPKTGGAWGDGTSLVGPAGPAGADGTDGTNGTNGTNGTDGTDGYTILNGSGAPSSGTGVDGDFYIDTTNWDIYGPKAAGAWGSGTSIIGPAGSTTKVISLKVLADATALTTGDGKMLLTIPAELNGYNLTGAHAAVYTASSSGLPTVQLHNLTDTADMLTTPITIDEGELNSYDATTAPVIDATHDDVATGDRLRVDVDVAGTGTAGLEIILTFALP